MKPFALALTADHDLEIPLRYANGLEAAKNWITVRMRMVKGEWFRNLSAGIDWYGTVFARGYTEDRVRSEFQRAILECPGVTGVAVVLGKNAVTRTLTVRWKATVDADNVSGEISGVVEFQA